MKYKVKKKNISKLMSYLKKQNKPLIKEKSK